MTARQFECNTPDVIFEDFGNETILINLKSGRYYSLDPVGMALWNLLAESVGLDEVLRVAGERWRSAGDLAPQIEGFLQELLDEELLRPAAEARPLADPATREEGGAGEFTRPVLGVYHDMNEMLLLDPIHDVSETGWPQPLQDNEG